MWYKEEKSYHADSSEITQEKAFVFGVMGLQRAEPATCGAK